LIVLNPVSYPAFGRLIRLLDCALSGSLLLLGLVAGVGKFAGS